MTKKCFSLCFSLCFLLAMVSSGQGQPKVDRNKEKINLACDNFMKLFVEGKIDDAIELLKQNTVMTPGSLDTLKLTITEQIENVFPQFGKILSFEFIKERKVKDFIAKRFYVIKFTKFFLKVDFMLYNFGSGWTITAFRYNEDPEELFENL